MQRDSEPAPIKVHLEPWAEEDLALLQRLNEPDMTENVGGPETEEKVVERHGRYVPAGSRQYAIVLEPGGHRVGWVGYWEMTRQERQVWETGWAVIPEFQGRGVATAATAQLLELARAERGIRYVHAFPMVVNAPSNAICRRVGFTLLGEIDFPGRRGGFVRCNDWRYDLFPEEPVEVDRLPG